MVKSRVRSKRTKKRNLKRGGDILVPKKSRFEKFIKQENRKEPGKKEHKKLMSKQCNIPECKKKKNGDNFKMVHCLNKCPHWFYRVGQSIPKIIKEFNNKKQIEKEFMVICKPQKYTVNGKKVPSANCRTIHGYKYSMYNHRTKKTIKCPPRPVACNRLKRDAWTLNKRKSFPQQKQKFTLRPRAEIAGDLNKCNTYMGRCRALKCDC